MDGSPDRLSLFRASSSYGNVVLNFRHAANDEFCIYAHAFHQAGQILAEKMFDKAGYSSLEACPIVFLYRHALELYLKAIGLVGIKIMQLNGDAHPSSERLLKTHHLLPLLPLVRHTFDLVGWVWELEIDELRTFEDLERLLQELEAVDPGSHTFRYPVDPVGHPSVPHHFMLHVPTFCQRMNALLDALEAAMMGLEVTWDQMIEAVYHAQNGEDGPNDTLSIYRSARNRWRTGRG